MNEFSQTFETLERVGIDVDRGDPQSDTAILKLEEAMGFSLPDSYKRFLQIYGYGGPEYSPYKGIINDDPFSEVGESALYVTKKLQSDWALPSPLLVVHTDEAFELVTCLDLSSLFNGECRVVLVERTGGGALDITVEAEDFVSAFEKHMDQIIQVETEQ